MDGQTTTYSYDANGNRSSQTGPFGSYAISPTSNQMLAASAGTPKQYIYDAAGNMLSDGTRTFTYSERGRLVSIVDPTRAVQYRYNAAGQRVAKLRSEGSLLYAYDEYGKTLGEFSANGPVEETVYLGHFPVVLLPAAERIPARGRAHPHGRYRPPYYIYADQLGAPRIISNSSTNTVAWNWSRVDPFGAGQPVLLDNSLTEYNQRFPGQLYDAESKLHHNYYRDYDPQTGRYIQSDPIGLEGGVNTYGYVDGNPLSIVDPHGLNPGAAVGAGVGTAVMPGPGTIVGALIGTGLVAWGFYEITSDDEPATPAMARAPRPSNMNRLETRHFDRHCADSDDPCRAIKAAVMTAIEGARGKMENMYNDKVLFRYAYSTPNPTVTGTNTTWTGHIADLNGRTNNIWAMISLGRKMGCDMSAETAAAMTIHTPGAPRG